MATTIDFPLSINGILVENCEDSVENCACKVCDQGCWDALSGLSVEESACYAHFMAVHGDA